MYVFLGRLLRMKFTISCFWLFIKYFYKILHNFLLRLNFLNFNVLLKSWRNEGFKNMCHFKYYWREVCFLEGPYITLLTRISNPFGGIFVVKNDGVLFLFLLWKIPFSLVDPIKMMLWKKYCKAICRFLKEQSISYRTSTVWNDRNKNIANNKSTVLLQYVLFKW